jgi:CheY-like chemotaxis protein
MPETPPATSKRILMIDDEGIVRTCGERTLRPVGYEIDTASDGAHGLEMLRATPYDLVITDLKMPGMDGIEVMGKMRSLRPGMKIIVISGYITDDTRDAVHDAGAFSFVEKPFSPEDLIRTVVSAIGWAS